MFVYLRWQGLELLPLLDALKHLVLGENFDVFKKNLLKYS